MDINSPTLPSGHPDRLLDLIDQLDQIILEIADIAAHFGWSADEFSAALTAAADRMSGVIDEVVVVADFEREKVDADVINLADRRPPTNDNRE